MGVTVEAEQDQNRKKLPLAGAAQRQATTRNFPVIAEKPCRLNCIELAVGGMRKSRGNPPIKWRKRSKKAATPGFPNRNSPLASATGKPGWRLDSKIRRY
ncbi:hypothetical protein [Caballeronia sp. KNU42]